MIPLVKGDKIESLFMHAWVAKTFFKIIKPFPGFIKFATAQFNKKNPCSSLPAAGRRVNPW